MVTVGGQATVLGAKGRQDPRDLPLAVSMGEALAALVIVDQRENPLPRLWP
jgi:hypothetical protein